MEEKHELLRSLSERIHSGKDMADRLKTMTHVDGVDKLVRKIGQEIRFLEKVQATGNVKQEHLQSTNLIHLDAMVSRFLLSENPTSVVKPFKYQKSRLEVDIVCNSGSTWVKVIARNARALTLISLGNGEYGQKSVLDQADSYLKCAKNHPHMYKAPEIVFHFAYGIEAPLASRLECLGVTVEGQVINSDSDDTTTIQLAEASTEAYDVGVYFPESENESSDESEHDSSADFKITNASTCASEIKILNLDVSTLLAFVSNMTNGFANFIYREPLLTRQAEWERNRPVKPILEKLFENKELVACRTAYDNFMNIVDVIGGPNETLRAKEFMKTIRVIDDIPTGRIMEKLPLGGKIKDRSRLIFATGENMKSITVSANEGFVRAARMQGIECMVFLHEPRSLSEVKEGYAERIDL